MNKKQQWINDTINSMDNAKQAAPKPFLLTRLYAKMNNKKETIWDRCLQYISKPSIAFTCVCLVIAVNVFVIANGYKQQTQTVTEEGQYAALNDNDDEANSIFNDNENLEP